VGAVEWSAAGFGSMKGGDVPERLQAGIILFGLFVLPAIITWLKGQRLAFAVGFLFPGLIWTVIACRLADPSSWWARRFYGPKKMRRAIARFGSVAS
jgi:hypothetical protein